MLHVRELITQGGDAQSLEFIRDAREERVMHAGPGPVGEH